MDTATVLIRKQMRQQPTAAKTKPKAVAFALVFCSGIDRRKERKRTRNTARPLSWGRVDRDAPAAAPTMALSPVPVAFFFLLLRPV